MDTDFKLTYALSYKRARKGTNLPQATVEEFVNLLVASKTSPKTYCELLKGKTVVKPYYDWDRQVDCEEDISQLKSHEEDLLEGVLDKLHPDADIAFADRSGWNAEKKIWKISLRAFVQNIKLPYTAIAVHIKATLGDAKPKQLDISVYKPGEQLLGCIYCEKNPQDPRVLMPSECDVDTYGIRAYVVQDVEDCELLEVKGAHLESAKAIVAPRVPASLPASLPSRRLQAWLADTFNVDYEHIHMNETTIDPDGKYKIPTRSKACPFKRRDHKGNHLFFTITMGKYIALHCYDGDCKRFSKTRPWSLVPQDALEDLPHFPEHMPTTADVESRLIPEAQRVLSTKINKALNLGKDYVWGPSDDTTNQRGVTYYERNEQGCVGCLRGSDEHSHSHQCRLMFSVQKQRRNVAIDCLHLDAPMSITAMHPGLFAVHDTYRAELRVSGNVNVKITKEKEAIQAQLIEMMFQRAQEEGVWVDETDIYKRIPGTKCCMESAGSHLDFLKRIFRNNPDYNGDPTRSEKLEKAILRGSDDRLPNIKKNKDWIGLKNGLFNIRTRELIPFVEVTTDMEGELVARHYIDQTMNTNDPSTPLWDRLISNHVKDPHVQDVVLALVGRTMFPAGTDNHDLMLYFYGPGQRGKSTAVEVIQAMHNKGDTAVIGSSSQNTFVAAGKDGKSLVVFPDMPEHISQNLDAATFKSMTAGEDISLNQKRKDERSIRWRVPLVGAGNVYPNWPNDQDSISRRLAIVEFTSALTSTDDGVKQGILKDEIANLLYRSVDAYWRILRGPAYARQSFYKSPECPTYFIDTLRRYQARVDPIRGFLLATPENLTNRADAVTWVIKQDPDAKSKWTHVQAAYDVYVSNTSRPSSAQRLTPDLDLWKALNCTFKSRVSLIKDCPDVKYDHRCTHANKAKSHDRTTGILVKGLSVTTIEADDGNDWDEYQ